MQRWVSAGARATLTVAQEHLCYAAWEMGRGSGSEGRDEGDGGMAVRLPPPPCPACEGPATGLRKL